MITLFKKSSILISTIILSFLASNAHAQLWLPCGDDTFSNTVTEPGYSNFSGGYAITLSAGDIAVVSMTPGSATMASWRLESNASVIPRPPAITGGTVSNTLIYTAVEDFEQVPSPVVDSINGTATLSLRCVSAQNAGSLFGIPVFSPWGLLGTGLLLAFAAAFHFRLRRNRMV